MLVVRVLSGLDPHENSTEKMFNNRYHQRLPEMHQKLRAPLGSLQPSPDYYSWILGDRCRFAAGEGKNEGREKRREGRVDASGNGHH